MAAPTEVFDASERNFSPAETGSTALHQEAQKLLTPPNKEISDRTQTFKNIPSTHNEAQMLGPFDPERVLNVTVMVKSKATEKEIDQTLDKIISGKLKPLSNEEYNAKFGADPGALQRVLKLAGAHHLEAREVDPNSGRILLSGKAKDFDQAFKINWKDFDELNGGPPSHPRSSDISAPPDINQDIDGILGLDSRKIANSMVKEPPPEQIKSAAPPSGYLPNQVADAYDFPKESMGAGQNVAIIELGGGLDASDNAAYYKEHNFKVPEINVITIDGATNQTGSQADGEVALDSQVIGTVAPEAKQNLVFAPNTPQGFVDAVTRAAFPEKGEAENSAISISWGAPESTWAGDPQKAEARHAMDLAFKKAALKGISIFCASGDAGSKDDSIDKKHTADFPATDPWVTGTGGTKLIIDSNGHRQSEVAWNDDTKNQGGGGISAVEPIPDYQNATKMPANANGGNQPGRGVPDIAGNASSTEPYKVRFSGADKVLYGTSAVAPLYAALTMRVNGALGHNVGFLNQFLYQHQNSNIFFDVTEGNNTGYNAGPGWDAVTGLGVIDGEKLLNSLRTATA